MGAIDRYTTYQYGTRDDWTIADPCPFCDGRLSAEYRREILEVRCLDCAGLAEEGNFTFVDLPSSGIRELDRQELLDAAAFTMMSRIRSSIHGICWDCHAPLSLDANVCDEHTERMDGNCATCRQRYQATIGVSCATCGTEGFGPLVEYAIISPPVRTFFESLGSAPWDIGPWRYRLTALESVSETVLQTGPLTVAFEFSSAGATRGITVETRDSQISLRNDSAVPQDSRPTGEE